MRTVTVLMTWAERVIMVAQDAYVRTVHRKLWRDAGL